MEQLDKYLQYLPVFVLSFFSSFLLTPIVGYLAKKFNIVDLPASQRKIGERGASTRIHTKAIVKLGGLAVIIPFVIIAIIYLPIEKELIGLLVGVVILTIGGYLDDKFELPGVTQLLFQVAAALAIVLSGTGIDVLRIPFFGEMNLNTWEIPFTIKDITYHLSFPSDLITVGWILLVINSMNWVAGIDALNEGLTTISAVIITLLSVRFFTHPTAIMGAVLAGGVLGFLPYNFNPAKIFSGSIGDYNYGYLLAVLSIYSGAKFATALMLLGIPIIDAIWVIIMRMNEHKPRNLKEAFAAMNSSGRVHLHHRLLDMGLTVKQVNYIEYAMVAFLGTVAFMFTGLIKTMVLFISFIAIIIFMIFTTSKIKLKKKVLPAPKIIKKKEEDSPEKKYAY